MAEQFARFDDNAGGDLAAELWTNARFEASVLMPAALPVASLVLCFIGRET